ncbi:UxaA family hydrolase [Rossellomorea marisflavi]|uniref:Altronate hydrolase n=1 Tax=Rossellomorea marisflavi TaxID=189381 RepID=A0A0J5SLH6_9BACI|nr:altronate dehydratase family protein [Rossellomorea marisflavi]KMK96002.1 altronate hydrolase [Rossellomorea marisflavi]KML01152.1 altronate hydrolase [Rossellomorea marisflavi]KZE44051.1 altronate hydrolase [Rossellomorea marisflavi]USK91913.1 altronate dehydratase family protein [Rossellomorea marisflavi]
MNSSTIVIHERDNVLIALRDFEAGERVVDGDREVVLREAVPAGHKIAREPIQKNENVIKFGMPIGRASEPIDRGDWIHTHNVVTNLKGTLQYDYKPTDDKIVPKPSTKTFQGYIRENGEVGIRNEIWIINTVGCINKTAEMVAKMAGDQFEGIDGVHSFSHLFGCSQLGDDLHNTQKILSGLVHHPNAAGILVMGLGCENNYIEEFKKVIGDYDPRRVKFIEVQSADDEISESLELIEELADYAKTFKRQEVPLSKLKVGLKCGGSDGFSGITGNPLVGAFSDRLISEGGTTILTEVPEMFGAEEILMSRAKDEAVFGKIVDLVNDFKEYFLKHGQNVYENPSPGNKKGGITTLEEKSLGNIQKGGFGEIADVLAYGDRTKGEGLHLVQGPGNDLVSVTALTAAGAHIVLFTTGRGTPFGGPVPTVKISTNSALAQKKTNWIDFNAGQLIEGRGKEELADEFFEYITGLASGEARTHNERLGFKEISIFKDGVTL